MSVLQQLEIKVSEYSLFALSDNAMSSELLLKNLFCSEDWLTIVKELHFDNELKPWGISTLSQIFKKFIYKNYS